MFIAYAVVGILLAFGVLASAAAQISRNKVILENLAHLGIPLGMLPFLATCLIAGGVGLLVGLWYPPLGIAAAVGLVLYFVGALIAHLRKGDVKGLPAPMLFLILAGVALSVQVL
ncbi:MAG: DoxX family protein [Betaproteobacteria bacterium]